METAQHLALKRLSVAWLIERGCTAAASEVRCPLGRFRLDAAGYQDRQLVPLGAQQANALPPARPTNDAVVAGPGSAPTPTELAADQAQVAATAKRARASAVAAQDPAESNAGPEEAESDARVSRALQRYTSCPPRTIIVECKASRADFLRDAHGLDALLGERDDLLRLCEHIETHRIPRDEPHLKRAGSSLFPECEEWDFAGSVDGEYQRTLARLARIDEQLYGGTKLHTLQRYRLADELYLATPAGLLTRRELPTGWGLIEVAEESHEATATPVAGIGGAAPRDAGASLGATAIPDADLDGVATASPVVEVVVEPPARPNTDKLRQRLLRNIAAAATRAAYL